MAAESFFNKSSFVVVPIEPNPDIEADTDFKVHLFIYDTLSLLDANGVFARMFFKSGRTVTYLDSLTFVINKIGPKTWALSGNIPSADWKDGQDLGVEATITFNIGEVDTGTVKVEQIILGDS